MTTHLTSSVPQIGRASPPARPNSAGFTLSLSPPISSLQDDCEPPSSPLKEKRRKPVPVSGRGGLGNIRARKKSKSAVATPSPKEPLKPTILSRTMSASSAYPGSMHSSTSSGASIRSGIDSIALTLSSGTGSTSAASGSAEQDEDYHARIASVSIASSYRNDISVSGSPQLSATSSRAKGKTEGMTPTMSVATDYALHLHADARQRALEKKLAKEREKEGASVLDGEGVDGENVEEKVVKLRSGRGGAGTYKKVGGTIDPALHPRSANIAREYEERAAAQEKRIVAESRVRSAVQGSTGRGGSGNVGVIGKSLNKKIARKEDKGKGRAVIPDDDERELSLEVLATREERDDEDDATLAQDGVDSGHLGKKKGPGLRRFLKCVVRSRPGPIGDTACQSSRENESTPRPSLGDGVLEIRRPSSPLPSAPSVSATHYIGSPYSAVSPNSSLPHVHHSAKLRKLAQSGEELGEGAALLAFVNAALPDLPNARNNVLGVPGTPGFPLLGERAGSTSSLYRGQVTPSSRSSTPVSGQSAAYATASNGFAREQVVVANSSAVKSAEPVEGEKYWVDDETLQDVDDLHVLKEEEEEEEEDSDIDPQVHPSISKQQRRYSLPRRSFGNRPDSLDVVIRIALDKLDLAEGRNKDHDLSEAKEAGEVTHALSSIGYTSPEAQFRLPRRQAGAVRSASPPSHPPSSFILPPSRYLRASGPVRSNTGVQLFSKSGIESGKTRVRIPTPGPPPVRPVPRLPEEF